MRRAGLGGATAGQRIEVPPQSKAETIDADGCRVVLRRIDGVEARELYLLCQPTCEEADPGRQTRSIYRAILGILEAEGGSFASVVCETLFLRDIGAQLGAIRSTRRQALQVGGAADHRPATTEIQQPPVSERACLEVSIQALLPGASPAAIDVFEETSACDCADCVGAHGLRVRLGREVRFYAGGFCGRGRSAHEQTLAMFEGVEALLSKAGMQFADVVRTWIHLRDIDRDYEDFNRARRAFFESRGIDPVPASTGIGGLPASERHDLCLGLYAIQGAGPQVCSVMTSPTLNEAPQYGADFVRGMRVSEANKVVLHVSGTASIDEEGRTAHPGDFEAQADRMLLNIEALLAGQGATFADVVSAITYLKHAADAPRVREKLEHAGFGGFPSALVVAPICRADLLCETEALAVLPGAASRRSPPDRGR